MRPTMPEVNRYRVVFYGSSGDRPNLKAKVELYSGPKEKGGQSAAVSVGKIKFHDGTLPPDGEEKGSIVMNLPHDLLGDVVDLLRNESPIYFAYHEGRAVLGTGVEEIGTRDEHVPQLVKVVDTIARPVPPNVPAS
jgi:hypothetical protein